MRFVIFVGKGEPTVQLAVLSDIHGNLPALDAVLNDLQQYSIDGIVVAGDIVNGGPQPVETLQRLRALECWMIRGNADNVLLKYAAGDVPAIWLTHHQFALLRWTHQQIDQEMLDFLKSLPEQRVVALPGTDVIRVVHGSPRHVSETIFPDRDLAILDTALAQISEPVLVCGHTHLPWQVKRNDRFVLNPGAVSGPLNGFVGAQYALLNWQNDHWLVKHYAITYDLERVRQVCQENGFLEEGGAFAQALLLSIETGQDVIESFFSYAFELVAKAGISDSNIIPDKIWDQASTTFEWSRYVR